MRNFMSQAVALSVLTVVGCVAAPAFADSAIEAGDFTGFKVNIGAGYGGWSAETTTVNPATGQCRLCAGMSQGGAGGFMTIGLGYDYQFTRNLVAGAFADFDLSGMHGNLQDQDPIWSTQITEDRAFSVGARAGWLIDQSVLPFISAGFTQSHFTGGTFANASGSPTPNTSPAFSRGGWFAGVGVDAEIAPDWFLRGEYRRSDYGTANVADNGPGSQKSIAFHPIEQSFRAGIVYKFSGLGGHPAARTVEGASAEPRADRFTGLNVGLGVGYGLWTATESLNALRGPCNICGYQTQGGAGPVGRVTIGYDRAFTDRLVAGVFADFDLSRIRGSIQDPEPYFTGRETQDYSFGVGARTGWVVSPGFMPYVTFGFTQAQFGTAHMVTTFAGQSSAYSTPTFTLSGLFAGVGGEASLTQNWLIRGEYRYADYGSTTLRDTAGGQAPQLNIVVHPTTQTFLVSAIYRFDFLKP